MGLAFFSVVYLISAASCGWHKTRKKDFWSWIVLCFGLAKEPVPFVLNETSMVSMGCCIFCPCRQKVRTKTGSTRLLITRSGLFIIREEQILNLCASNMLILKTIYIFNFLWSFYLIPCSFWILAPYRLKVAVWGPLKCYSVWRGLWAGRFWVVGPVKDSRTC